LQYRRDTPEKGGKQSKNMQVFLMLYLHATPRIQLERSSKSNYKHGTNRPKKLNGKKAARYRRNLEEDVGWEAHRLDGPVGDLVEHRLGLVVLGQIN
jgi:hypothetical protein